MSEKFNLVNNKITTNSNIQKINKDFNDLDLSESYTNINMFIDGAQGGK